jgi:hypothetical protein
MKTKLLILTLALGIASPVLAADQTATSASVITQIKKEKFPLAHFLTAAPKNENFQIEHEGGMSSRPWTQIARGRAGENFSFMDARNAEPNFTLVSLGAEPQNSIRD